MNKFRVGEFLIESELNRITASEQSSRVEPKVMQVLLCLVDHAGEVVTKEQLIRTVWADTFVTDDVLTRSISELRKAFQDHSKEPHYIQTIPRSGYRLIAKIEKDLTVINSVAVLPLNNLSGDPSQEYFAEGMTEALISNLSQIRALRVISRFSSMRYKRTNKSLQEIARELNVAAVIEGSVQRSGTRVLVTARLIHAATDSPTWSREYDRDLRDVLKLQSEIARAVTEEIRIQVTPNERTRLSSARSVDPEAHEEYLLGRYHLSKRNEADLNQAITHFRRAIDIAPDYAAAYGGLAEAWKESGIWAGKSYLEVGVEARAAVLKAIELDDQLAEGHMMLGQLKFIYDWEWTEAEREFNRALELDPGKSYVHRSYATFLMALGRFPESISEIRQAIQLDPFASDKQSDYGRILYRARNYEEAISALKRAIELEPRDYSAHVRLGDVYAILGRFDEAIASFERAIPLQPNGSQTVRLARVFALMGKEREARKMVSDVKAGAGVAAVYVALGDADEAFRIFETAIEERNTHLAFIKEEAAFDKLHSDTRWNRLLQRMNFPAK